MGQHQTTFRQLAELLGDLPLALAQAIGYMDVHGISVDKFLALYRDRDGAGQLLAELRAQEMRLGIVGFELLQLRALADDHLRPGQAGLQEGLEVLCWPCRETITSAEGWESYMEGEKREREETYIGDGQWC